MNRYTKCISVFIKLSLFVICITPVSGAQDNDNKLTEEQYKLRKFDEIKKSKDKEYKSGVHNDGKKDQVKNWIGEDINYQKKVIKLKSDYRSWAEAKISGNEKVNLRDYEPLKTLSKVEYQILKEYHNRLFGKDEKQSAESIKRKAKLSNKAGIAKKAPEEKPELLRYAIGFHPKSAVISEETDYISFVFYPLIGFACLAAIAGIIILIIKKNRGNPAKKNRSGKQA